MTVRPVTSVVVVLSMAWLASPPLHGRQSPVDRWVSDGKAAMYRLDYDAARDAFTRIVDAEPDRPVGYGMMSVLRWNELLLAASNLVLDEYGTPSPYVDAEIFEPIGEASSRFHAANDELLEICTRILEDDPDDVEALYFQGLAYENLAAEALTIKQSKMDALSPGRRANAIHEDVLERNPTFVDANISVASYKFALATVPALAKMFLLVPRFFGFFRGDKKGAFELLELVGRTGRYRDLDARVVLSVMHAFKGEPRRAVTLLEELADRFPTNYMIDINLAAVQELNLKDPAAALGTYQDLLASLPSKAPGLAEAEVLFRIGRAHLRRRDHESARAAFRRAIAGTHVEAETVPLSHFYLAQIEEEHGSHEQALVHYRRVVALGGSLPGIADQVRTARREIN